MMDQALLSRLNAGDSAQRLKTLKEAVKEADFPPMDPRYINNHIHTTYSFSPYSPSAAVYAARLEGLCTAGIVDHDSMGGCQEFLEAGRIVGRPVTIGVETRVSMQGTRFSSLRTNNPDQEGLSYMVLHAVPHKSIGMVQEYFKSKREHRNQRNRNMVDLINQLTGHHIDFDRDVLPLSEAQNGGAVTERHLMQALARAEDPKRSMMEEYDRIGQLKKDFIPRVYINADEECPKLLEYIDFCKQTGGILAYSYLGDVTTSVTGDKKAQRFEDEHLDSLFDLLDNVGIRAITYMPTRNTQAQLDRLRALCRKHEMLEISGEDINSPRQSFVIKKMEDPQFENLITSTWDLIKHENGGTIP